MSVTNAIKHSESVMLLRVSEMAFLTARTEDDSFSCFLSEPKSREKKI